MNYRKLGNSGLRVSEISLGSWLTFGVSVDDDTTEACMRAAYDAGVNFFDGAEGYGDGEAELAMGRVFKKAKWPRDTMVVSSKVIRVGDKPNQSGLSRKHLVEACDAALQRMGLDYLDLFFCHRPDPDTSLQEIVHTMNELIGRGKIFYWGTSEFSVADLTEMYAIAREQNLVGPTMEQSSYSMLARDRVERSLAPLYANYNLGTTVYSPLAFGILTGKYNDGIPSESRLGTEKTSWLKSRLTDESLEKTRKLTRVAGDLGIEMSHLALAWILKNDNVSTAIVGATKPAHVVENVKASEVVDKLDESVMKTIEDILEPSKA